MYIRVIEVHPGDLLEVEEGKWLHVKKVERIRAGASRKARRRDIIVLITEEKGGLHYRSTAAVEVREP